ncbi:hypothetical protein D3C76_1769040 [compost metagenome]
MRLGKSHAVLAEYFFVFPIRGDDVQVVDIDLVAGHQQGADGRFGALRQVGDGGKDPVAQVRERRCADRHPQVTA